ncbi:calcium/proton exchanger [Gigaspora margarita]|uniref:Calcium/proton exchanger n=1 Tax=Gigaspora margarita TaxID=4874 RepID=A0A8H4EV80_GIGMA|nr:calcium/proton exchanger [Gigaspora margarita]
MDASRLSRFSKTPTFSSSIKTLLNSSSVNLLLIFVPFGIVYGYSCFHGGSLSQNHNKYYKGESKAKPKTTLYVTIPVLIFLTTIVIICANYLSKSIVGLAESWNISIKFIGLILIPNVDNASDYLNSIAHV